MGLVTSPFFFLTRFSTVIHFYVYSLIYTLYFPGAIVTQKKKRRKRKGQNRGRSTVAQQINYIPRLQIITSGIASIEIETR